MVKTMLPIFDPNRVVVLSWGMITCTWLIAVDEDAGDILTYEIVDTHGATGVAFDTNNPILFRWVAPNPDTREGVQQFTIKVSDQYQCRMYSGFLGNRI